MPLAVRNLAVLLVATVACLPAQRARRGAAAGERSPNIVLMLADDQAWDGLGVAMHPGDTIRASDPLVDTPRIAALAAAGLRFTQAYAPAPVCAPTRIAIQTGLDPATLHWTKAAKSVAANANTRLLPPTNIRAIPAEHDTIGELLQRAGYRTAHFGKWHLNGGGPEDHGYDVSDGNLGNEAAARFEPPNPVDLVGMVDRARDFMADAVEREQPFYVQLSWHALHAPENASPELRAKYGARLGRDEDDKAVGRAALTEDLDGAVGRVLETLEELGLTANTYVFYTSDNGGGGGGGSGRGGRRDRVTSLRGGKGSLHEAGIRVPLIVRGPGIPAGGFCDVPVTGLDFLPTFLTWAGAAPSIPEHVAGGSLAALVENPTPDDRDAPAVTRRHPGLLFHFPHYQGPEGPHAALRHGDLKLVRYFENDRIALFDLAADPGETRDLAQDRPEDAERLARALDARLRAADAQLPRPNPDHDPSLPSTPRERRRRR